MASKVLSTGELTDIQEKLFYAIHSKNKLLTKVLIRQLISTRNSGQKFINTILRDLLSNSALGQSRVGKVNYSKIYKDDLEDYPGYQYTHTSLIRINIINLEVLSEFVKIIQELENQEILPIKYKRFTLNYISQHWLLLPPEVFSWLFCQGRIIYKNDFNIKPKGYQPYFPGIIFKKFFLYSNSFFKDIINPSEILSKIALEPGKHSVKNFSYLGLDIISSENIRVVTNLSNFLESFSTQDANINLNVLLTIKDYCSLCIKEDINARRYQITNPLNNYSKTSLDSFKKSKIFFNDFNDLVTKRINIILDADINLAIPILESEENNLEKSEVLDLIML